MATVFLGYRRIVYDRLSASWKGNYCIVLCRTNIKLLDVMKQKHWWKLSLRSFEFFMTVHQCISNWLQALSVTEFVQLNHPAFSLASASSDHFLIRNQKYHLCGTWFTDHESLTIVVEAWCESKQKILFSGHKQMRRKVGKCVDVAGECRKMTVYMIWYVNFL